MRIFEIVIVFMLSVLLILPMALTTIIVWLDLGRPIFFTQARAGRGGRIFQVYKFRTMRADRNVSGALLPDAARQTRLSFWLRRLRFDEMPQLLNIAKGDMAFVGPRPLLPETVVNAGARGVRRGLVRPGLTGWAQISGNTLLSEEEKLSLDLWYVDNRSFLLDARIMLETLKVVLIGERRHADRLAKAATAPPMEQA